MRVWNGTVTNDPTILSPIPKRHIAVLSRETAEKTWWICKRPEACSVCFAPLSRGFCAPMTGMVSTYHIKTKAEHNEMFRPCSLAGKKRVASVFLIERRQNKRNQFPHIAVLFAFSLCFRFPLHWVFVYFPLERVLETRWQGRNCLFNQQKTPRRHPPPHVFKGISLTEEA